MRNILRYLLSAFVVCLLALTPQDAFAGDVLAKYKLNLSDPDVCKVYYMRGGNYQALDSLKVGVKEDGTDSLAKPYERIKYLYDGKFIDCRGIESTNVGDYDGENCVTPNQGFIVFDFGEKGIDFQKIVLYNDGYYQRHQQGTVFVAFAGPTADGDFTEDCVEKKYQKGQYETATTKLLRTNGSNQSFAANVTNLNNWMTGSENPSENEPGYYATTVNTGTHLKYRYVAVYDWSNYMYLSEVEIYGVLLKNSTYNDKQLDLERAIAEAQAYVDEFAMSDPDAVYDLRTSISTAQALLDGNVTDEAQLAEAGTALKTATDNFMGNITYKLGDNEFYCAITTASQENGLKLASEKTTVGNYTGYVLQSCLPDEALSFSVSKSAIVNGQQAYQLSTANGVVIQTGSTLMLVDPDQVTASNPAKFVFTMRYSDGENALYDFKAGNYFYYLDENGSLANTESFPEYESFEEIIPYTFMLTPSSYPKTKEEAEVNFKGWEFNDPAKDVTAEYGDKFGKNAGNIVEGWRLNKWRMYTRVGQVDGIMTVSVNNPYYANEDTLAQAPLAPAIDENSVLTSANNGAGICRENGQYSNQASRDPINQVRDSTYLEIVNPIYCPYIAVKIAGTDEKVDLSGWGFTFFIKKGGIEPSLNIANAVGKKGDVYYWRLTDCGFTVGQVGYSAQYMGFNTAFQSTKQAAMIDWIRPYESIDAIPEESFTAEQIAAVVASLPENPKYEAPEYEVKKVEYLGQYIKAMNASNADLTSDYTDAIKQLTDKDYATTLTAGTSDVYYVVAIPEAIRKFQSVKVYYKKDQGNDYSTNVFFYTANELNISEDSYASYVPNGGGLWMHTAFSGDATKDEANGVVTFTNTNKETITYIALRGDNGGNPLNATEIELFYYDDGTFEDVPPVEPIKLDSVNYWTLTTNWVSTRKDGSVVVNEDGSLTANAGSDNAKRADIKNATDKIYLGDHKVVFYVAEPTAAASGVTQNYGDMKFGYTATVAAFNEKAVVNEQFLRGNASNTEHPVDGGYLVYFDLSSRNANVAFFTEDSGNKFDGETKDSYRAALNEETNLIITAPNFTLIGSDATNFNITKMGSAKDVETLLAAFKGQGTGIVNIDNVQNPVNAIFDLQGRRVIKPTAPGIYIIGGKQTFIK